MDMAGALRPSVGRQWRFDERVLARRPPDRKRTGLSPAAPWTGLGYAVGIARSTYPRTYACSGRL